MSAGDLGARSMGGALTTLPGLEMAACKEPAKGQDCAWYLIWCHERCHKEENEACRQALQDEIRGHGASLVCLKKAGQFGLWLQRNPDARYALVTDWREAKPCMEAVESHVPMLAIVVCDMARQATRAMEWTHSLEITLARTVTICERSCIPVDLLGGLVRKCFSEDSGLAGARPKPAAPAPEPQQMMPPVGAQVAPPMAPPAPMKLLAGRGNGLPPDAPAVPAPVAAAAVARPDTIGSERFRALGSPAFVGLQQSRITPPPGLEAIKRPLYTDLLLDHATYDLTSAHSSHEDSDGWDSHSEEGQPPRQPGSKAGSVSTASTGGVDSDVNSLGEVPAYGTTMLAPRHPTIMPPMWTSSTAAQPPSNYYYGFDYGIEKGFEQQRQSQYQATPDVRICRFSF
eukprot:CAMPEP_0115259308 /NCGR_PEP_ID=MMETSP0270-20121206/47755_1 /TAXON_ID=71861 /ORGANISM="Scrippsiella trochoidea, Strain CCMP3099" /LENGTH=399 /DNA_ID=CAMNT_0002675109 /DNA_START=102 /DNA_END=1301 /DNA_ORIENTATION=+